MRLSVGTQRFNDHCKMLENVWIFSVYRKLSGEQLSNNLSEPKVKLVRLQNLVIHMCVYRSIEATMC